MSIEAMSFVFRHSPYQGAVRLVHLALADVANDAYTNEVWLGLEGLAKKAHCAKSTVVSAVKQMISDGYLQRVSAGGGRGQRTVYRLLFPETVRSDDSIERETVRSPDSKLQETVVSSDSFASPSFISNSIQINSTTKRDYKKRDYSDEEEEIWQAYPSRKPHPDNKSNAIRNYRARRAAGASHADLLAATRAYATSREGQDPLYTKMAATFFGRNEHWRTFLPETVEPPPKARPRAPRHADFARKVHAEFEANGVWLDSDGDPWYDSPSHYGIILPEEHDFSPARPRS